MRKFLAGLLVIFATVSVMLNTTRVRAVDARDRTLEMFNIHNGEKISVQFKKDGKFVPEALEKLNYFYRDWRTNEPTTMDPRVFDIVWELHEELGSRQPVHLISGYRSPKTNEKLRKNGGGQAKQSQHTRGQASDIHFPDVSVQRMRYSALVRERGGVGYYPTSAKPFVHVDTGRVRMWPRMPRQELALLFPNGKSKYMPADGKPIAPADVTLARANYGKLAQAIAAFHEFRAGAGDRTLVASLEPQQPAELDHNHSGGNNSDDEGVDAGDGGDEGPSADAGAAALTKVADAGPAGVATDDDGPDLSGPALKPATRLALAEAQPAVPKPMAASRVKLASLGAGGLPAPPKRLGLDKLIKGLNIEATISAPKGKGGGGGDPPQSSEAEPPITTAAADPSLIVPEPQPISKGAFLSRVGWASAPDYDDDHDSELSYRAFPLGPLLTRTPSMDNPVLASFRAPDLEGARDMIGRPDGGFAFLPRWQVAELDWGGEMTAEDLSLRLNRTPKAGARTVKTAVR